MQLPDLWRTTVFRLTLLYGAVFVVGAAALLALVYAQTAGLLSHNVDRAIDAGIADLQRADAEHLPQRIQAGVAGDVRRLNYYGLYSRDGVFITGNVPHLPPSALPDGPARDLGGGSQPDIRARAVTLPWGEVLLVGRDISQLTGLRAILLQAMLISGSLVVVLGLVLGSALSVRPLRRLQALQSTSQRITHGDLSARLPVSGARDELDLLAGIVNGMIAEIERLLEDARSVGDTLAHDLRTPLTRLRALLYRVQEEAPEASRPMVERALAETDSVLARFRALLRIAEIERQARRSGFRTVDLGALVRQAAELYEPLAEAAGVTLAMQVEAVPFIEADPELLFEALSNLIDNAIKFTPAGGRVGVHLRIAPEGPLVEVIDDGPGIAPEERDMVLNRFHRGANASAVPGSGLGLAIVAAVTRLHGFGLTIGDAEPGFKVTLTCRDDAPAAAVPR